MPRPREYPSVLPGYPRHGSGCLAASPDDPSFSHLYLHAGGGTILAFIGPSEPSRTPLARGRLGVGSMQCISLQLDTDSFEEAQENLRQRGVAFTGPVE